MDTKLKKGKKIRSFLYRIIAAGAFLTLIGLSLLGRESLVNLVKEGPGTLTGNIYYLTEFREYVAHLYTQGMLGYAGIGDDNGYPLTDEHSMIAESAKKSFKQEVSLAGKNLLYYVEQNGRVIESNITLPLFSEYDGHVLLPEDTTLLCYWDGSNERLQFFADSFHAAPTKRLEKYYTPQYQPNAQKIGDIKLLIAFQDRGIYNSSYIDRLTKFGEQYRSLLLVISANIVLLLLSWMCCLFTIKAGRQVKAEYRQLISKLALEVRLLIGAAAFYVCFSFNLWDFAGNADRRLVAARSWGLYFLMGMLIWLLYIDFKGHGAAIFRQSFVCHIWNTMKEFQAALPWQRKLLGMYHCVLGASVILITAGSIRLFAKIYYSYDPRSSYIWLNNLRQSNLLICIWTYLIGLLLLLTSRRIKNFISDTIAISNKMSDITIGGSNAPLLLHKHSLLTRTAQDLNAIGSGIEAAVEQNNRSNKMRVELITNVSHDLKTPLTSIINYADLLCEEELPEQAAAYAQSLRDKSYRLKSMVQDVFDLSKATSGNLTVEKNKLDLAKLIRQTLADMDERITESNLLFKLNIVTEPLYIEADGEKLYRVFQNLFINALQYSLDHSRVHVVLEAVDGKAFARIKNTSRQELTFTAEEIMERFVRADASRTTEGSGLGLSIVQSFTEACGGTFAIEMDADLFTACVSFPLIEDKPEREENNEETTI